MQLPTIIVGLGHQNSIKLLPKVIVNMIMKKLPRHISYYDIDFKSKILALMLRHGYLVSDEYQHPIFSKCNLHWMRNTFIPCLKHKIYDDKAEKMQSFLMTAWKMEQNQSPNSKSFDIFKYGSLSFLLYALFYDCFSDDVIERAYRHYNEYRYIENCFRWDRGKRLSMHFATDILHHCFEWMQLKMDWIDLDITMDVQRKRCTVENVQVITSLFNLIYPLIESLKLIEQYYIANYVNVSNVFNGMVLFEYMDRHINMEICTCSRVWIKVQRQHQAEDKRVFLRKCLLELFKTYTGPGLSKDNRIKTTEQEIIRKSLELLQHYEGGITVEFLYDSIKWNLLRSLWR